MNQIIKRRATTIINLPFENYKNINQILDQSFNNAKVIEKQVNNKTVKVIFKHDVEIDITI